MTHLNKLLYLIPLVLVASIPIAQADAPKSYSLSLETDTNTSWDGKKTTHVQGVTGTINNIPISEWDICDIDSKYGTTCQIIIIAQHEKMIEQNEKIIKLLEAIKYDKSQ